MKKVIVIMLAILPFTAFGQYLEGGAFLGTSNYSGDLVESNLGVELNKTKMAGGIFIKYNINDWVGVRGSFTFGQIQGSDADKEADFRQLRNLSFRSNISEVAVIPEFNILGFNPYDRILSPYVFVGLGIFNFNPQAELDGIWYDLQPLGTEGQGLPGRPAFYNLTQLSIPYGIGVKYAISEYWTVAIEFSTRYTFTDYLDDVSTTYVSRTDLLQARGELSADLANRTGEFLGTEPLDLTGSLRGRENSDWFHWSGITISYNFMDGLGGRKYGCPTF